MPLLSATSLSFRFGKAPALSGFSCDLKAGEIVCLLGPNGSGKTTALRLLAGILKPSSGRILRFGKPVETLDRRLKSQIAYLPDGAPADTPLRVQDHLRMMARLRQIPPKDELSAISRVVHQLELEPVLTARIGALSRGFRQRLGLAESQLHRPRIMLLDEPLRGLDPAQLQRVLGLMRGWAKDAAIVLSSHNLLEMAGFADRALVLSKGRLKGELPLEAQIPNAALQIWVKARPGLDRARLEVEIQRFGSIQPLKPEPESRAKDPGLCLGYRVELTPNTPERQGELARAVVQLDLDLLSLARESQNLFSAYQALSEAP